MLDVCKKHLTRHVLHTLTDGTDIAFVILGGNLTVVEELLQTPQGVRGMVEGDTEGTFLERDHLPARLGETELQILRVDIFTSLQDLEGVFGELRTLLGGLVDAREASVLDHIGALGLGLGARYLIAGGVEDGSEVGGDCSRLGLGSHLGLLLFGVSVG